MELAPVFKYQSARRYLVDYVSHKQRLDTSFSLRKWAKTMGMGSHAHLVMILQGKRSLTLRHVPTLAQGMQLSSAERLYFQALIQFEKAKTQEEKDLCLLWLSEVNPGGNFRIREVDEFSVIAHWVHMAILALTETKDFSGSAEEIHRRLGGKVSVADIRSALERLSALGLVKQEGGRLKATYQRTTTRDDIASAGAREYHKQVARLGIEAVEAQSVLEREFQSFAISVPHDKLALAKEMIRKFRAQFSEAIGSEAGDDVYQTQIQFFRLTERPSGFVPTESAVAASTSPNKAH